MVPTLVVTTQGQRVEGNWVKYQSFNPALNGLEILDNLSDVE